MSATTTDDNYIKKVLPVRSPTANQKKRRRRRRKIAIAKLFAFHAGLKPGCGQN